VGLAAFMQPGKKSTLGEKRGRSVGFGGSRARAPRAALKPITFQPEAPDRGGRGRNTVDCKLVSKKDNTRKTKIYRKKARNPIHKGRGLPLNRGD